MGEIDSHVVDAVADAMGRPEVLHVVEEVHAQIGQRIAAIHPVCQMSGRCCRFEQYGHRMFVTTIELAAFAQRARALPELGRLAARDDGQGCRFQENGMCAAHAIRPMGCRLFFCDETTEAAMQELYEEMHQRVRQLHDRHGIAYAYVEWRSGLRAIATLIGSGMMGSGG